jgi:TetR/AcrR family tetracycline transcriptional repressor
VEQPSGNPSLPRFDDRSLPEERRQPLTRVQVVETALEVLDESGLAGLTMRHVAERLGVKSASLYWHVRDKDELLNLVADAICAEIRTPSSTSRWRERLLELAWEYRRVLLAHRDAALLMASTLPVGPHRLRLAESGLATMLEAGFSPEITARASLLFTDYVTNFVVEESRWEALATAFDPDSDSGDAIREWFEALPADQYPSLVALAEHLTDPDSEARFEFGAAILLAGLSQHES